MRSGRLCLLFVCGAPALWCGCRASPDASRHEGFDAQHRHRSEAEWQRYQERLESPNRAEWQRPERVVAALKLRTGERVADIGTGTGYFAIPIARAVGPEGKVYAVDVARQMIDYVTERARKEGLEQVIPILAPANNPSLPDTGVDTIFIVNTYHHFDDRASYLTLLDQALAPGGRIVNIDFIPKPKEERGFGPPLEMQLSREQVDAELASAGFVPDEVHDFLPEQYFVEYRRP